MSKVAIITVPGVEPLDLYEIKEFVKESLMMGILVKGQGVGFEIADIPDLGGVVIHSIPEIPPVLCQANELETDIQDVSFVGCGAKEKRRIHDALLRFRAEHGLGCLEELASAIGEGVTAGILRDAIGGAKLEMNIWRQIGLGLDRMVAGGQDGQAD